MIQSALDDHVLILRLAHGKANALSMAVLSELDSVLQRAADDREVRAIVLGSASTAFFSAGFDVGEVFRFDRSQMREFFGKFIDVYEGLQRLPKAVVAAVTGHCYAGGAILALACDWRVMAEGSHGFALNEINVGISLPSGISRMVVNLLGTGYARQMLLTGDPVGPSDAMRLGLVHEIAPAAEVMARATDRARQFAKKPPATLAAIKRQILEATGTHTSSDRDQLEVFLAEWDTEEAIAARSALLKQLGN